MKVGRGSAPLALASVVVLLACGSRTGLLGTDPAGGSGPTTGGDTTGGTTGIDVDSPRDAEADALPPIDTKPRVDASVPSNCPDADPSATLVYVMTQQRELFSFYPPTNAFRRIGTIGCPGATGAGAAPFSMAVDQQGVAFVVFDDGRLYRVSTLDASCSTTPYVVDQQGFHTFGMGFAVDNASGAGGESLYVVENPGGGNGRRSLGLGRIDLQTFDLRFLGGFDRTIQRAELTGTGDGRLYAFHGDPFNTTRSTISELDKATGRVLAASNVAVAAEPAAFAFAFWGGRFYVFTARSSRGASEVREFDPDARTTRVVANLSSTVVGAGVSTCAPSGR